MDHIKLHPSFIEREGKKEYVVIPVEEFERLQDFREDARDLFALKQAKAEDNGERISLTDIDSSSRISPPTEQVDFYSPRSHGKAACGSYSWKYYETRLDANSSR
ncbi:MAG: hypothetical protein AAF267_02750 [Deinococcota bacterium]